MLRYQSTKQNQEDKKNSLIKNTYLDLTYKLTIFNLDNSVRNNRREPPPPPNPGTVTVEYHTQLRNDLSNR